jgi:peptidylprolyl isomerase
VKKEKIRGGLHRAGWLFLVILFVVTTFGAAVGTFWVASHQSDDASQTQNNTTDTTSCTISPESGVEKLAKPAAYKPGKADKLVVTDLVEGKGQAAKSGDCLVMKYYGTLASSGDKFDENFTKDEGLKFQLGTGQVIPGWDKGLVDMKVGGTRRLVIPPSDAYGSQAQGGIPANSTLVFVVKLESIK